MDASHALSTFIKLTPWLLGLGAVVALAFGGCTLARRATYPAPDVPVPSPPLPPLEELQCGEGGERVSCWVLPLSDGADGRTPVILAFHGNGENIETMRVAGTIDRLGRLGAHVVVVDYPGYGRSGGRPDEESVVGAGECGYRAVKRRFPANPVLIWGWSLGAAVAAQVASRHASEIRGAMLLSPWSRLSDVAKRSFPSFLVAAFLRDEYDSLAAAARITAPSLVVHGDEDDIIPADQGRAVAGSLPRLEELVIVEGAGHNDLLDREEAWAAIARFTVTAAP